MPTYSIVAMPIETKCAACQSRIEENDFRLCITSDNGSTSTFRRINEDCIRTVAKNIEDACGVSNDILCLPGADALNPDQAKYLRHVFDAARKKPKQTKPKAPSAPKEKAPSAPIEKGPKKRAAYHFFLEHCSKNDLECHKDFLPEGVKVSRAAPCACPAPLTCQGHTHANTRARACPPATP